MNQISPGFLLSKALLGFEQYKAAPETGVPAPRFEESPVEPFSKEQVEAL